MRSFTCLAAALSLATLLSLPSTPSEACGYGILSVFRIANHPMQHGPHWRSFALLGVAKPANATEWSLVDPSSYIPLAIAAAPELTSARRLTLVGPAGTRKVASAAGVLVSSSRETDNEPMMALDLGDTHGFEFAVTGPALGLNEVKLAQEAGTPADEAWLAQQDLPHHDVRVAHVGDVEILSTTGITVVRSDDRLVSRSDGMPVGMLASDDTKYLLVEHDHAITPVMI
jgi:hypothetical protein